MSPILKEASVIPPRRDDDIVQRAPSSSRIGDARFATARTQSRHAEPFA